ncbi:MAG TPA: FAD/NAD(P)-binding protein [Thermodesulfobacteriota bacterium]|nr:FAD/NAD(P)-binding protein [Thermodesulfobacteriota bacterium]
MTGKIRKKTPEGSPYLPVASTVEEVVPLTARERLFRLRLPLGGGGGGGVAAYGPGQFFMAGLPGYGEAPFSVASPWGGEGSLDLCIRAVGNLTNAIHRLEAGDTLWVRGPFGRGFAVEEMERSDVIFIAGGIGMVPLRSLVKTVLERRKSFGRLTLLYGSKTPEEILFKDEMPEWEKKGLDVRLTVDSPTPGWKGGVGVVTTLVPGAISDPPNTAVVITGPPVMYRFVIFAMKDIPVPAGRVYLSLERRMKCGLGKCGHCQINHLYACQEGPVFTLDELSGLTEAFS